MQTLTELATKVVRWERTNLPKGAYRVSNIEVLALPPDTSGFGDCSYDEQFLDELIWVKAALGMTAGVWVGLILHHSVHAAEVLALLMD